MINKLNGKKRVNEWKLFTFSKILSGKFPAFFTVLLNLLVIYITRQIIFFAGCSHQIKFPALVSLGILKTNISQNFN